jgi:ketosteroid isomerase-like protein
VAFFTRLPTFTRFCVGRPAAAAFAQARSADETALDKTDAAVRTAFGNGDLDAIRRFHHPDVVKSFSSDGLVVGRDQIVNRLAETFNEARLEFVESKVESSLVTGNSAVRISHFSIRSRPKAGGPPTPSTGRAMVVYIRTKESATGWATIREMVQPAP